MQKRYTLTAICLVILAVSCGKNFLNRTPKVSVTPVVLANAQGVDFLLIGAYSILGGYDGFIAGSTGYEAGGGNWIEGDLAGGNCYKGSDASDQVILTPIELHNQDPTNVIFQYKWQTLYEGISRANQTIRSATAATDLGAAAKLERIGEARFLRGHFHFDAKQIWNNPVYIDEKQTSLYVVNTTDIWPLIEADFKYASANLPLTQAAAIGRATKGAAQAYLGKVYLFEHKYAQAKVMFDSVINTGLYSLAPHFQDNFSISSKNSSESVFSIQSSVNDGSDNGENGNFSNLLNYPYGPKSPFSCCGFECPSQDLVNAYQTDGGGLPLLDTYAQKNFKNDFGITDSAGAANFKPDGASNIDPRLDWSVGRNGIPYYDYGIMPGYQWIRNQSIDGPYCAKKFVHNKAQIGTLSQVPIGNGWVDQVDAQNIPLIRYADVLLMDAECNVELGNLTQAMSYVNMIRDRAAASPVYLTSADGTTTLTDPNGNPIPAAHYKVGNYGSFPNQNYARKAVRFERRLELAFEGHQFFDLVRYSYSGGINNGYAMTVLNAYMQASAKFGIKYYSGAGFKENQDEYFPIPANEIQLESAQGHPVLKQNPGY